MAASAQSVSNKRTIEEVMSPRTRRTRTIERHAEENAPSTTASVSFVVKVKSLTTGTWAVTSVIDLGSQVHDEARFHDVTTTVSWTDIETWSAESGYVIPAAFHLVPLGMRGTQVRKVLNALCDLVSVPVVLRYLKADHCLTAGSGRSIRLFSRQLSSGQLDQLMVE